MKYNRLEVLRRSTHCYINKIQNSTGICRLPLHNSDKLNIKFLLLFVFVKSGKIKTRIGRWFENLDDTVERRLSSF